MESIFLNLLNMSITASWIVAAVLLLRFFLRKAPKYIRLLLWLMVAIRLAVPISFESILSLIPNSDSVSPQIIESDSPAIQSGIEYINDTVNPVIQEMGKADAATGVPLIQTIISISTVVWAAGLILMLLYLCISTLLLARKVRSSVRLRDNLWQNEAVSSPFILGLIKPRIYMPFQINNDDIAHVVAHENAHIQRGDHWIKPLGFVLLSVHWFNPLAWLSYILLCRDIEMACDERVVKNLNANERKAYTRSLVNCSANRGLVTACPLAFGEVGVKHRVKNILNYKKPAFWIILVSLISCIAIGVCFLTNPKSDVEKSQSEINERLLEQLDYGQERIIKTIEINNLIYEVTDDWVSSGNIGDQLGTITRQVSPRPEQNGDIAINIADSPSLLAGGSSAVFKIDGLDLKDGVALQKADAHYYRCNFYCYALDLIDYTQCSVFSVSERSTIDANWYKGGQFNFNYEELNVLTVYGQDTLYIHVGWPCDSLTVWEDYYEHPSATSVISSSAAFDLTPVADGVFCLTVERRNDLEDETAIYYIQNNQGKFIFKVNFPSSKMDFGTYVYDQCLYMNPASTFRPAENINYLYVLEDSRFTIQNISSSTTYESISYANHWETLTEDTWTGMFASTVGQPNIDAYLTRQILVLSDRYILLNMEGQLWFIEMKNNHVWSIYQLMPDINDSSQS